MRRLVAAVAFTAVLLAGGTGCAKPDPAPPAAAPTTEAAPPTTPSVAGEFAGLIIEAPAGASELCCLEQSPLTLDRATELYGGAGEDRSQVRKLLVDHHFISGIGRQWTGGGDSVQLLLYRFGSAEDGTAIGQYLTGFVTGIGTFTKVATFAGYDAAVWATAKQPDGTYLTFGYAVRLSYVVVLSGKGRNRDEILDVTKRLIAQQYSAVVNARVT